MPQDPPNGLEDLDFESLLAVEEQGVSNLDASAFPTTMNCSQAFDQLLKCYSVGNQVRSWYRYGELQMCQDKRAKLLFCMKTKLSPAETGKERVREWHMRQLAEQQHQQRTSESVWESRESPLRMPFREDIQKEQ